MDFGLTREQLQMQKLAREVADKKLADAAREWDLAGRMDRAYAIGVLKEAGLVGMTLPEEYGGAGLGFLDFIIVFEQIARVAYPAAFLLSSSCSGPVSYIRKLASDELRRAYLPRVAAGELVCGIAITEPQAGSDLGAIQTRLKLQADGTAIINGSKVFVGGGGDFDVYVTFVRMSDEPGTAGLGCVLVDTSAPGLKFGPPFRMLGSRAVPRHEIIYDDCVVPAEHILARPGEFRKMIDIFNAERVHNGALALGVAQGAYEFALDYAKHREQFGRPLTAFQGLRWKIADMATSLEAARLLIYRAAWLIDQGESVGQAASMAKLFAAEAGVRVVDEAMQLTGAYGYSEGSLVERAYRDVRLVPIAGGSVEMMRNYLGEVLTQ